MGRNKALLDVGGAVVLHRTVDLLRARLEDVFLVADDPAPYAGAGVRVLPDVIPRAGALGGIHAACVHASTPFVLVAACDMPLLEGAVIDLLIESARPGVDAVIPRPASRPEPLLALYASSLAPALAQAIAGGRLRVMDALGPVRVAFLEEDELRRADPGGRSFVNVNTPEDLAAARALAAGGPR